MLSARAKTGRQKTANNAVFQEQVVNMKKYNLEILTLMMFGLIAACAVFCAQLSLVPRVMLAYMFLFTLHEWEENRFPGGFSALMAKFFGLRITAEQEEASHIPVGALLVVSTWLPFFTQSGLIALIPVYPGKR